MENAYNNLYEGFVAISEVTPAPSIAVEKYDIGTDYIQVTYNIKSDFGYTQTNWAELTIGEDVVERIHDTADHYTYKFENLEPSTTYTLTIQATDDDDNTTTFKTHYTTLESLVPATADDILAGKNAYTKSGTKLTGTIATKTSSDVTVDGSDVTVPAGYYASAVTVVTPFNATLVEITQAAYDQLVEDGDVDENTLYLIVEGE